MPPEPLVSILINNYNYARFLPYAIESALNQTYPRVEVIVADDGSTDDSFAVIQRFGKRVTGVRLQHGGQGAAVNAGFSAAHGDLVALLDSDDFFDPDKIRIVVKEFHASPNTVLFCHPAQYVAAGGEELGRPSPAALKDGRVDGLIRESGGWYAWPPTSCLVVNRRLVQRVFPIPEEEFAICADAYICDTVAFLGRVKFIPRPLSSCRLHGENSWSKNKKPGLAEFERGVRTYRTRNTALNRFLAKIGVPHVELDRSFMYRHAVWRLGRCRTADLLPLIQSVTRYPAFGKVQRARAVLGLVRSWLQTRVKYGTV